MSSPSSIVFSVVKTHNVNKTLEKDDNGYYKVCLGGLNTYNSAGAYYVADGVKELVSNPSSLVYRRLKSGYLNGEMGHPSFVPGMTKTDYILRNMKIDQSNISHHIKEIEFIPDSKGNMIRIMGWVKPSGPHGELLKQALDNPDQNVAFSIRSFTDDTMQAGRVTKKIKEIITWDWVVEPGIKEANSWDTLAMESYDLFHITLKDIRDVEKELNVSSIMSNEATDIRNSLNSLSNIVTLNSNSNDVFNRW